jgi:hypothetical protein
MTFKTFARKRHEKYEKNLIKISFFFIIFVSFAG